MQGYQLIFSTYQSMKHGNQIVADWILDQAKDLEVPGATMNASQNAYGSDGKFHSAHFFELAEQPLEVMMVVTNEECEQLFARIEKAGLEIFYSKVSVEFGTTGKSS